MKPWLKKLRLSLALDSSAPRREKLPRGQSDCDDVMRCAASLQALDRRLKVAPPPKPVPAALHASVMRAMRAAAESQERRPAPWNLRWLPAPALALLVVFGLWWALSRSPHEPQSLTVATVALEQSHALAQKAPDALLAPLAQEMNNLNRDFQNAVEFLAANIP